ncbi:hypothetical protein BKA65DRAFT_471991 [Rhexocercosporidium sp. MPI-PUGE-AT-0058]|nr:hypothetical protein BKA65DRAFT_471991 [Rhexocercosporidium sp. MPI-PUGE-AT-0058]
MGRPPLLNETCIAAASNAYQHLTSLNPTVIRNCAYRIHEKPEWRKCFETFFIIILTFMATMILFGVCCSPAGTIKRLRETPSHQLHRAVEEEYKLQCLTGRKARQAFEDTGERYVSVSYVDDRRARRRTVTVVEDLAREPCPRNKRNVYQGRAAELVVRDNVASRYGGAVGAPFEQPSPFVNARVRAASSNLAPSPLPQAVARNENTREQSGNEYTNSAPPPPPYKQHQWQSIV